MEDYCCQRLGGTGGSAFGPAGPRETGAHCRGEAEQEEAEPGLGGGHIQVPEPGCPQKTPAERGGAGEAVTFREAAGLLAASDGAPLPV